MISCISPKKVACGTNKFDASITGVPYYDAMLCKEKIVGKYKDDPKGYFRSKGIEFGIQCITPEEYFIEVAKFHTTHPEFEKLKVMRSYVEDYKDRVLKCSPMPLPILDYKDRVQEGRHRAMAALELGIQKMPVLVIRRYKK